MPGHRVHRLGGSWRTRKGSTVKGQHAWETCFGRWRRSALWPHAWDTRRRSAFWATGLWDTEPAAFHWRRFSFHLYGPSEFFCALIQTVSFCTTVQRKDFSLPHGLQRALRWMDIILGKQALEMDNGQRHILWSVWCYRCMTNWRNIFVCFENRNCWKMLLSLRLCFKCWTRNTSFT